MRSEPKLEEKGWDINKEKEIFRQWELKKIYAFNKNSKKKIWSVDTPPPYPSGYWHMGGALHYSQIDMISRFKRMMGFEILFPMGIDRNGLPVEIRTEKEFNVKMFETPRERFLEMCREVLAKYENQILEVCRLQGFSVNSLKISDAVELNTVYRTDSPGYRTITQATFIELWKRGRIFTDNRPNNWCTECHTTIADAEVEYKDIESVISHIQFKLKDGGDIVIATTRPELLCACRAILVHPEDGRYKHLYHKKAIIPIYNRAVEIIPHPEAKMEFGTGIVMICSYGDYTDVRLFRDMKLEPIVAIDPDGKMTKEAGFIEGLTVKKARETILEKLKENGLVLKEEKIVHKTPVCYRSKNPIEFIAMPEYYLKQVDFVDEVRKISDNINFHPQTSKQILLDWLNSITVDWPISRRRYYGTEIPIWYCQDCGESLLPEPGKYYQPWKEPYPGGKCTKCGSKNIKGEERTFDTWMDSSISELVVTGYLTDDKLFKMAYPCSVRPQGKDIVRTWLYYTLLRGLLLTKKKAFEHVWVSGHVVDEKGAKMSKSAGNVVMPEPMIKKYGSDALRLFGVLEARLGSDIRFSESRLAGAAKFIQKLYNISRFISMFPSQNKPKKLEPSDEWILNELNLMRSEAMKGYEELDFFIPANLTKNFAWELFADHYIEIVKGRAYENDPSAQYTIHHCLREILKLLAPIAPFITDYVWGKLYGDTIHLEQFDRVPPVNQELAKVTSTLKEFNSVVWKFKKDSGQSLRSEVKKVIMPQALKPFEKDLQMMHNIKEFEYGPEIKIMG